MKEVHFSELKCMEESPAAFKRAYDRTRTHGGSKALEIGLLTDRIVFGGDMPHVWDRRAGKLFADSNADWSVTSTDFAKCAAWSSVISTHPIAKVVLKGPNVFNQITFHRSISGVRCAGTVDAIGLVNGGRMAFIADLKTTICDTKDAFLQSATEEYHYDAQIAMYGELCGVPLASAHYLIGLSKPTSEVFVVTLHTDEDIYKKGRQKVMKWLDVFKQCTKSGEWPEAPNLAPSWPEWPTGEP